MLETSARLLRLLTLLQSRRDWPGAELAARLAVTARTLRRDVERLRSLGYPVQASAGVGGGYRLGAGSALPPLLLDDDEALAVALGLRMAATGTVVGMESTAVQALVKLQQVLPARLRRRLHGLHDAVAPLASAGPRVSADVLTALAAACRDHVRVRFRYSDHDGQGSDREVEPHGVVCAGARWYLVAWDVQRGDWRSFRIDRVAGDVAPGARFSPRKLPQRDLAAYVSRSAALAPYAIRARLVLHAPLERMRERIPPLAGSLQRLDADRCLLEAGAHAIEPLACHLALLDVAFEVESPDALRERLRALGHRLLQSTELNTARAAPQAAASTGTARSR